MLSVSVLCLLVSPSDPTLTVENVAEVMEMVVNWEGVGVGLGIPYSKQEEIIQQSLIERVKSNALVQYWVNTDPDASWKKLARVLYWRGEERAAATVRQYMPKGIYSTLLPDSKMPLSLYVLILMGTYGCPTLHIQAVAHSYDRLVL